MTLGDMTRLAQNTAWFSNLGNAKEAEGILVVQSLEEVTGIPIWEDVAYPDEHLPKGNIFDYMIWFPCYPYEYDPFYNTADILKNKEKEISFKFKNGLDKIAEKIGKLPEIKKKRIEINKLIYKTFPKEPKTHLDGLHVDFMDSSQGSFNTAAHAYRSAVTEILLGIDGPWQKVIQYYAKGHSPLGYIPKTDQIVVL